MVLIKTGLYLNKKEIVVDGLCFRFGARGKQAPPLEAIDSMPRGLRRRLRKYLRSNELLSLMRLTLSPRQESNH